MLDLLPTNLNYVFFHFPTSAVYIVPKRADNPPFDKLLRMKKTLGSALMLVYYKYKRMTRKDF